MVRVCPKRPGSDDHCVGGSAEQSHDHPVLRIEAADVAPARLIGGVQRNYAVERNDEVADNMRPAWLLLEAKRTIQRLQLGREGKFFPLGCVDERFQGSERHHRLDPQILMNSARSAEFVPYSPRQYVVLVSGKTSRTPRI